MFRAVRRRALTSPGSLRVTLRVPCFSSVLFIIVQFGSLCKKEFVNSLANEIRTIVQIIFFIVNKSRGRT